MSKIRITKEFKFEAAHALWNYNGLCQNIHGHSYRLYVTLMGIPISDKQNPKFGMIMDFTDLKNIIKTSVVDIFDHSLIVFEDASNEIIENTAQMYGRLILTDYQPTCENMVADFAQRIKPNLPDNIKIHSLKLYETATAYCEWFAEDN